MSEVGDVAPRRADTHVGHVWVQVIRRSVRSYRNSQLFGFKGGWQVLKPEKLLEGNIQCQ